MKHVSILVYNDVLLTALSSTLALFESANEAVARKGKSRPFEVELVGVTQKNVKLKPPVQFSCTKTISDDFDTDVVVIPPMSTAPENMTDMLNKSQKLIEWIKKQYASKAQVICLCTGAYLLAESGLLDGMPATSHWGAMEDLQKRYTSIHFKPDHVVTNSKSIITGGGGFSALNAIVFFIEKTCGKEVAIELTKYYALDYGRTSQNIFTIFTGQRLHNDDEIHSAQTYIEKTFKSDITIDGVAKKVNMSKRNFIRRFKKATTLSPIEFIQKVKVEAAKKALERGEKNIAALTYNVGYNDLKTFRAVFKKITGLTPIEYRDKYNNSAFDPRL